MLDDGYRERAFAHAKDAEGISYMNGYITKLSGKRTVNRTNLWKA